MRQRRLPLSGTPDVDEFVGCSAFTHLTMITCGGPWDRIKRAYSHQRIVRARLVAVEGSTVEIVAQPLGERGFIFRADQAKDDHRMPTH